MAVVGLSLFKAHVKADDFSEDDAYLEHLLNTAEDNICKAVNRSVEELKALGGGTAFPPSITHAVLLLAGHWYNQREAVGSAQMAEVPYTMQALIKPYVKLIKEDEGREDEIPSGATEAADGEN